MNYFKKKAFTLLFALVFAATAAILPGFAHCASQDQQYKELPAEAMAVDLVIIRPLAIVATAMGCTLFAASLPFTVWTGERIKRAGKLFVVDPGYYAFVRPLGEFE